MIGFSPTFLLTTMLIFSAWVPSIHTEGIQHAFELPNLEFEVNVKEKLNELLTGTDIQQIQGDEVLVINLWATWCGPCIMEVPDLNDMVEKYEGRKVRFIAFSDEEPHVYQNFLNKRKKFRFAYELSFGNIDAYDFLKAYDTQYDGRAIPLHLMVTADGQVEQVLVGASPMHPRIMDEFLNQHLNE